MYTVHFRSRDLKTLFSQGHFWHLNFLTGGVVINQDEVEIFTYHEVLPPGADVTNIDPIQTLRKGLGGIGEPCPIKVEQILVTSTWKSNLFVADAFRSTEGRVFLAGDAGKYI